MTNVDKAKQYGGQWARSMFTDFLDHPEYRGSNFTWEGFPKLASGLAGCSFFTSLKSRPKNLRELESIVRSSCESQARELVKKMC